MSIIGLQIYNLSIIGLFWVALFHRNKYHVDNRIFLGWDFNQKCIPCLEQDYFGLQFSTQISTMKYEQVIFRLGFQSDLYHVLSRTGYFWVGQQITQVPSPHISGESARTILFRWAVYWFLFNLTLHYITSHGATLKHIHKNTLHYIILHNITLQNFQNSFLLKAISHNISALDVLVLVSFFHHFITLISNRPVLVSFEIAR